MAGGGERRRPAQTHGSTGAMLFPGGGSRPCTRPLMRRVPIGLDRGGRRVIANAEITVTRVVQEAVVNSYASHFARTLPESATGPGDGGGYACRNGLTGPRITARSPPRDWIDPRRCQPEASLFHMWKRMPYGEPEAAACTWTAEACVAAEAIAGLARTGPANPSDRMAEIKIARTVHMIPPWPFPRPAARGRDPASLPGGSTSCRVGSRLAITLCADGRPLSSIF